MREFAAHAEHVYTCTQRDTAVANSSIVASWRRCIAMHRLAPEQMRAPLRVSDLELKTVREACGTLIADAAAELDRLFATVGKSGCCLILTDHNGVALERRGLSGEDKHFHALGLWTGSVWTEASIGTNGIGTAIADERSVTILRDQHFFSSNISLSCTTAPIRDHRGQLAAALDISTCREDTNEVTLAILGQMVRDAALRIEINLFRSAFAGARFVMVPAASNPAAALLAVDRHDLVLGATRAARLALQLDDRRISAGLPATDALHEENIGAHEDLVDAERAALVRALSRSSGNVSKAAIALGMSRATLHRKMKRLNLH
ncbi:Fis family transcriptional regulator [Rhizobium sp. R72]|uniref:helix-turn-helix domain-containing protein n=1 Tax=unclassified Rhizobium TaxID=2613769 RepID=UPI000B5295E7|nr:MULTISPECIES: helix-turn-helix domain-containing protein [unclassified Rhizobium]OWW04078.1 Fis family transcriptional regulator [Rhizobium sp. R72]OWW04281.1 Fis family transcriptional regulator [Rhizobium sp. R711]